MRPYYQDQSVTIYHADFREAGVDLSSASAIVTDPPYGETRLKWDVWPEGWPALVREHCAINAAFWCWGSMRMFLNHRSEFAGWKLAQDIVWEKSNGSSLHTDRFRRVHELAVQFYKDEAAWSDVFKNPVIRHVTEERNRKPLTRQGKPGHWDEIQRKGIEYAYDGTRLARSVMFAPNVREGIDHGTPKPLSIVRDLVSYSVPAVGLVADIFCGSGSVLLAAKELGVLSIGIDADEAACEESALRCSQQMLVEAPL